MKNDIPDLLMKFAIVVAIVGLTFAVTFGVAQIATAIREAGG